VLGKAPHEPTGIFIGQFLIALSIEMLLRQSGCSMAAPVAPRRNSGGLPMPQPVSSAAARQRQRSVIVKAAKPKQQMLVRCCDAYRWGWLLCVSSLSFFCGDKGRAAPHQLP
jgi:hypothetical protein